ncbi:MAG: Gfo/Idh/MocA family oxidoreductase [Clostridiales bacterium]|nr:Gfo/Idh/MocA family oxidoreductase [Clostridiales bacterium]
MLKVMIVGCGGIAPAHIEGYLKFGELATITHLVDPNLERAHTLIAKYNLQNAIAQADYAEALPLVDAVSICTPPALHCGAVVDSLRNGCHVLVEKPMAPSLAECDQMIQAAQKHDRLLSVVVQSRFISDIRNVVEMVKSGAYGKNLYTRVHSSWYRGESYYDLAWRGRWEVEGGGSTQNQSIHHIDLLLWTKGMPTSIRSFMTNLNHHNSQEEDFSSSILRYEDGSIAELTSSLIDHSSPQSLTFQMEKAGIGIPFQAFASKARPNGFPIANEEMVAQVTADFQARPKLTSEKHEGQIRNFLLAINGEQPLLATAIDGRNCIELITGVYQSAIENKDVTFPITQGSDYYTSKWRVNAPHFFEKSRDIEAFEDTTITNNS